MDFRLVEVFLPEVDEARFGALVEELKDANLLGSWEQERSNGQLLMKVLFRTEGTPKFLDRLEETLGGRPGFRYVLVPVLATFPRPEEEKEEPTPEEAERIRARVSREELYAGISSMSEGSPTFVALAVLSTVVAVIGLLKGSPAVVIGAMVIAPLLGPNVGLSFATTLADWKLGLTALRTNFLGLGVALGLSVAGGWALVVDPASPEIAARTRVDLGDIGLALASGAAGALSLTRGLPAMLVGVMVAVALLPPLVTFGLMAGAGHPAQALGAFLLLMTNVICVNLAGVVTFLVQGVRPLTWWEADKAGRASRIALFVWLVLLVLLVGAILASRRT